MVGKKPQLLEVDRLVMDISQLFDSRAKVYLFQVGIECDVLSELLRRMVDLRKSLT